MSDDDAIASALGVLRLSAKPKDVQDVVSYTMRCCQKSSKRPTSRNTGACRPKKGLRGLRAVWPWCRRAGSRWKRTARPSAAGPGRRRWDSVPDPVLEKLKAARQELEGRSKTLDLPIPDIAAVSKAVDSLSGDPDYGRELLNWP